MVTAEPHSKFISQRRLWLTFTCILAAFGLLMARLWWVDSYSRTEQVLTAGPNIGTRVHFTVLSRILPAGANSPSSELPQGTRIRYTPQQHQNLLYLFKKYVLKQGIIAPAQPLPDQWSISAYREINPTYITIDANGYPFLQIGGSLNVTAQPQKRLISGVPSTYVEYSDKQHPMHAAWLCMHPVGSDRVWFFCSIATEGAANETALHEFRQIEESIHFTGVAARPR